MMFFSNGAERLKDKYKRIFNNPSQENLKIRETLLKQLMMVK
jgi:hypothetical protein